MKTFAICAAMLAATVASAATNYEKLGSLVDEGGDDAAPISSSWQKKHEAELAAATAPEAVAKVVSSRDAAKALLDDVKTAYETDPLVAFRIAEVTHYVMTEPERLWYQLWRPSRRAERELWTNALLDRARWAADEYVKIFCIEQLRWCAFPEQADAVRALGEDCEKRVRDFAAQIAGEIASRGGDFSPVTSD